MENRLGAIEPEPRDEDDPDDRPSEEARLVPKLSFDEETDSLLPSAPGTFPNA